jgi:hypothetical protein
MSFRIARSVYRPAVRLLSGALAAPSKNDLDLFLEVGVLGQVDKGLLASWVFGSVESSK